MLQTAANIPLKSPEEIDQMRVAGQACARILNRAVGACRPGVTTGAINQLVAEAMSELGAEPVFFGYRQGAAAPFPGVCCISVNEQVIHGMPGPRQLVAGDCVCIDVGLRLNGWCADTADCIVITQNDQAQTSPATQRAHQLLGAARASLALAVDRMRPGVRWSAIALELERLSLDAGLGIVTDFVGHGVGRDLHEGPKVPCFWTGFRGEDFVLQAGMVLAIEPILTFERQARSQGWPMPVAPGVLPNRTPVATAPDGWTVYTRTGAISVHLEHTIAVTLRGAEVLTIVEH